MDDGNDFLMNDLKLKIIRMKEFVQIYDIYVKQVVQTMPGSDFSRCRKHEDYFTERKHLSVNWFVQICTCLYSVNNNCRTHFDGTYYKVCPILN